MFVPSFSRLKALAAQGSSILIHAQPMHHNPVFYKYRWWIFHEGSPCEGRQFLTNEHSLSTAEAMKLHESFTVAKTPHWLYNESRPRLPSPGGAPWDTASERWVKTKFAPTFEDDVDAEWKGFK